MTTRKRLLGISELYIAKILLKMNDTQFDEYIQALKSFIEYFPARETKIKNAFEEKDYLSFSECFTSMRNTLIYIHADELAEECLKLVNGLVTAKHEKVEAHMTYLLSLLTMLSIDIQMALYNDDDESFGTETAELQAEFPADEKVSGQNSILAVDDNAFFLDTLKTALQGSGHKLVCVNSGKAALKFLENNTPGLLILDIEMPEMDGYELAQKIRESGNKAPILFLTGNATSEYVVKAIRAGGADFIVKPITQKHVLERIGKFI